MLPRLVANGLYYIVLWNNTFDFFREIKNAIRNCNSTIALWYEFEPRVAANFLWYKITMEHFLSNCVDFIIFSWIDRRGLQIRIIRNLQSHVVVNLMIYSIKHLPNWHIRFHRKNQRFFREIDYSRVSNCPVVWTKRYGVENSKN